MTQHKKGSSVDGSSFHIGIYSGDPFSNRVYEVENSLRERGVVTMRVIPWLVSLRLAQGMVSINQGDTDLATLDVLFVADLGGLDLGSHLSRLSMLRSLSDMGVQVLNPVDGLLRMKNKAECLRHLASAGVPIPMTLVTESIDEACEFVRENHPCVIKPIIGFGGTDVRLIENDFDVRHVRDYLKFYATATGKGVFLLQELIHGPGFDIRALVLEDRVIGTMQRVCSSGFVTNIHSGGTARPNDIDVDDIAVQAARAMNAFVAGVDIIPDMNGNLRVLEVNGTPSWAALQTIIGESVSDRISEALVKRCSSRGQRST